MQCMNMYSAVIVMVDLETNKQKEAAVATVFNRDREGGSCGGSLLESR